MDVQVEEPIPPGLTFRPVNHCMPVRCSHAHSPSVSMLREKNELKCVLFPNTRSWRCGISMPRHSL